MVAFLWKSNNISFSALIAAFNSSCFSVGFWFIGVDASGVLSCSVQSTGIVLVKIGGVKSFDKGFSVLVAVTEDVLTEGIGNLSFLTFI